MTTQHTPGPWKVVPNRTAGDNLFSIGTTDDQHTLADVWFSPAEGKGWHEVDAANARLIAAAPELLIALQNCSKALEALHKLYRVVNVTPGVDNSIPEVLSIEADAQAAIAKATQQ
jgi:hypothetical protein